MNCLFISSFKKRTIRTIVHSKVSWQGSNYIWSHTWVGVSSSVISVYALHNLDLFSSTCLLSLFFSVSTLTDHNTIQK